MQPIEIIVIIVAAAIVIGVIVSEIIKRKRGKTDCGSCGSCANCVKCKYSAKETLSQKDNGEKSNK